MTYLELVQAALVEAGITQTTAQPQSLDNLTGMSEKFRRWVAQAWDDIRNLTEDQSEFCRAWFQVTINPRFYFDLDAGGYTPPVVGDVLIGVDSGATLTVTAVRVVNNGNWADGSAQGIIDYSDLDGIPAKSEVFQIEGTSNNSIRWVQWGDWKLDSEDEMGSSGFISNCQDLWWHTFRLSDVATNSPLMSERTIPFLAYSQFSQNYDVNVIACGTPRIGTETPDDGCRVMFYPPPDRPYRLSGYYYTTDAGLVNDSDEPTGLKSIYHPMIVWKALMYYAQYEQQQGILAEATMRYQQFQTRLQREIEMPAIFVAKRLY